MSVADLARESGTSRTTLTAYEQGSKTPGAATLGKLVGACGFRMALEPAISYQVIPGYRGAPINVPDRLPRNSNVTKCRLPTRLHWSGRRDLDLRVRDDQKRAYEAVMSNGTANDIEAVIDRDVLLDIFDEMYLPPRTRAAWSPTVARERSSR